MRETGSLKKILEKYEPPPQVCPDYSGKPLGFGSVFTAFGVWCFGFGLGILIFAIESLSTLIGRKRHQDNSWHQINLIMINNPFLI